MFSRNRFHFYRLAFTRYDLHSSALAAVWRKRPDGLAVFKDIRKSDAQWQRWCEACLQAKSSYCLDDGTDGWLLPQKGLTDTFYVPIVSFWMKPWRIGLFASTFYRSTALLHRKM